MALVLTLERLVSTTNSHTKVTWLLEHRTSSTLRLLPLAGSDLLFMVVTARWEELWESMAEQVQPNHLRPLKAWGAVDHSEVPNKTHSAVQAHTLDRITTTDLKAISQVLAMI